jgi:hypothetical protein
MQTTEPYIVEVRSYVPSAQEVTQSKNALPPTMNSSASTAKSTIKTIIMLK